MEYVFDAMLYDKGYKLDVHHVSNYIKIKLIQEKEI